MVILSEYAGIEIIFGAFMFGMVIKYAQVSHREIAKIESFGAGFFIPLFFLLLGLQVPLVQVFSSWQGVYLTGIILLVILVVKLPLLYLAKWYSLSTTVIAYLLSTSTLIVSLALQHFDVFTHPFSEALVVASAITCIVPVILFYHNHSFGKNGNLIKSAQTQIRRGNEFYNAEKESFSKNFFNNRDVQAVIKTVLAVSFIRSPWFGSWISGFFAGHHGYLTADRAVYRFGLGKSISLGLFVFGLNIPLLILGWKHISKKFAF